MAYELEDVLKALFSPNSLLGIAQTLAGLMMMVAGTGGEVGGVVLDATGVGAVLGIPTAAVSAGLITAGGALAGKGLYDWMAAMANGDYNAWPRGKRGGAKPAKLRDADPGGDQQYGGHAYDKHVGESNEELGDRLYDTRNDENPLNEVSTYETYEDGRRFSQMVIDQNNAEITNWLSKAKPGSTRDFEVDTLGEVTGRQLTREDWENKLPSKPVLGARVVIRADPAAPNGYYILTSFPTGIDAATWLP